MCVLRVRGAGFDPRALLAEVSLEAYEVWAEGEPQRFQSRRHLGVRTSSGFKIDVSGKEWDDLSGQVADAVAFLARHAVAIAHVVQTKGVEDVWLDFPVGGSAPEPPVMQTAYFPRELTELAGRLGVGIEVSFYAYLSESDQAG